MTSEIEANVLYKSILDNFRQQFDVACRRSYVIALPANEALQNVTIDQVLVNSHILMPSKLLKMHFTPLQAGYASDDIEIDGKRLIIHKKARQTRVVTDLNNQQQQQQNKKVVIKILAEEIGYNSDNKPYKLILINRPLTTTTDQYPPSSSAIVRQRNPLLNLFGTRNKDRVVQHQGAPEILLDHNDCSRFLESISQQLTMELEREVQQIQSKYIIMSHYLQDAAERISQLTQVFIPKYIDALQQPQVHLEKLIESIRVSVENYAIHLLHGKLIASIYHRYEKNDATFDQKLELIKQSHSSVCQLGAQEPFEALEIDDKVQNYLKDVVSLQSPLAMVNSIVKIIDGISSNLDDCVRSRQLMMEFETTTNQGAQESVSICSDDLIASLIFALIQVRPSKIYSMSKYLELFNWSARDKAAYYTATFHVVVQYVYNYQIESRSDD